MLLKIIYFAVTSIAITAALALGLILSDRPQGPQSAETGLDFTHSLRSDLSDLPEPQLLELPDGWSMPARHYGAEGAGQTGKPLLIMVHGSGWNGMQFHNIANALSGKAHVIVPDLRGHGAAPARRGDVDYIGQMEDDLAALITAHRQPGQKVILAGHSSGGGLVVRLAGGAHGALMDRAILLAPFLKYNAPTTRKNSGGWARPLTRRIIGISMLNMAGITALNHLTVIEFNMPRAVQEGPLGHLATLSYSYRLNTGFAPRSTYLEDIAALPPFVLIAGSADEAFVAEGYADVMQPVTQAGQYHVIAGETHLSVVDAPETEQLIKAVLNE